MKHSISFYMWRFKHIIKDIILVLKIALVMIFFPLLPIIDCLYNIIKNKKGVYTNEKRKL